MEVRVHANWLTFTSGFVGVDSPKHNLADHESKVRELLEPAHCLPVFVSVEDYEGYYNGYANGVLWPAMHSTCIFSRNSTPGFDTSNVNLATSTTEVHRERRKDARGKLYALQEREHFICGEGCRQR